MYPEDFDDLVISSREAFDHLDSVTQVAVCIHMLEPEVNNGGFDQFFSNSSGMVARETIQALSAIGAEKTRSLLERAIQIAYPKGYPADPTAHQNSLTEDDEIIDKLSGIDDTLSCV